MTTFVEKPVECPIDDASIDWSASFMLVSSDESTTGFVVPKQASRLSNIITPLVEDGEKVVFPVKGLAHETVQNIAWWMTHFAPEDAEESRAPCLPKPFPDDHFSDGQLTEFERHFADTIFPKVGETNMKKLTGLLHGAQFVQLQPLLELLAVALSFHLRNKTPDEMKALMHDQVPEYTKPPPEDEDEPAAAAE